MKGYFFSSLNFLQPMLWQLGNLFTVSDNSADASIFTSICGTLS